MYYAGIGSRNTPLEICELMTVIASRLEEKGFTLRSGCAKGADQAFASGVKKRAQILLPWAKFEEEWQAKYSNHEYIVVPPSDTHAQASVHAFHPNPDKLSVGGFSMMRRNYRQIIGNTNSSFVLCWTEGGKDVGGTAQAIRIARANKIPVINLGCEEQRDAVIALIRENVALTLDPHVLSSAKAICKLNGWSLSRTVDMLLKDWMQNRLRVNHEGVTQIVIPSANAEAEASPDEL